MILAALAVQFINTDQSQQMGQAELQAYTVYKNIDNTEQGTGTAIEHSVLNALVIVTVIGIMTFGIVLLYKYRYVFFIYALLLLLMPLLN